MVLPLNSTRTLHTQGGTIVSSFTAPATTSAANETLPSPTTETSKPPASLGSMPVELLLGIARHLDVASLNNLSGTSSFNYTALKDSREQRAAETRYIDALGTRIRSAPTLSKLLPLMDRAIACLKRTGEALTSDDHLLVARLMAIPLMTGGPGHASPEDMRGFADRLGALGRCLHARQPSPWPDTHRQIHSAWRDTAARILYLVEQPFRQAALAELKINMPPGSHEELTYSRGLLARTMQTQEFLDARAAAHRASNAEWQALAKMAASMALSASRQN